MCFWMRWMGVSKYICLFRHPRFVVVRLAIGEGPLLVPKDPGRLLGSC